MLLERRIYTLQEGQTARFIDAQNERGYELIRPIAERLLGYFSIRNHLEEAIVHLYHYDDFQDWLARLHGLYEVVELRPYFVKVRALMVRQENSFYAPAPPDTGTTGWRHIAGATLEERDVCLKPGAVPSYWHALRTLANRCGPAHDPNFLGAYASVTGRLSRILEYRAVPSSHGDTPLQTLRAGEAWRRFEQETAGLITETSVRMLEPITIPEMSPYLTYP